MPDEAKPRHSRVRTWFCGVLAGVAAAHIFHVVSEAFDEAFGPPEAQLIVTSEAPLLDVRVRYGGREIAPRPGWLEGSHIRYALFPAMRTRNYETVLEVTWRTMSEERSLSRTMRQTSDRLCLYVLRLDILGQPVELGRPDAHSPFWWNCRFP
ncbi:hypothetical protein [Sediminicoccus rosea]|jgi:hypothetical protein|uniref:Uncharacterized protein n=1 Tax=Sediminicoccus rosea TaxID=1225128 RepID=A0ABZ0PMN2_9PROT|nr:hypothetical protein [Sediminicoccus rosea]WPB87000.1 hypothetical protein R9Z33_09015 [Sediminicoccus rosea]